MDGLIVHAVSPFQKGIGPSHSQETSLVAKKWRWELKNFRTSLKLDERCPQWKDNEGSCSKRHIIELEKTNQRGSTGISAGTDHLSFLHPSHVQHLNLYQQQISLALGPIWFESLVNDDVWYIEVQRRVGYNYWRQYSSTSIMEFLT